MITETKNSIFTISPYKWNGQWVFDDERVGLDKEAFVAGADTLLDRVSEGRDRVVAVFSDREFPDYQLKLERVNAGAEEEMLVGGGIEYSGTDYYCESLNHNLWLCPALNLYYSESPKTIFLKII